VSQFVDALKWFREGRDMGPIRAEGDPVDAHGGDHVLDVVLPERVDPNMAPEGLDGVFREPAVHLAADEPEVVVVSVEGR